MKFSINNFFRSKKKKKGVGLVRGGGILLGLAHIGVIKELEINKVKPDYIVGCSIGAIIGAYYAFNPNIRDLERIANSLTKLKLLKLLHASNLKKSVLSTEHIREFLEKIIGNRKFSEAKIPLKIIATDLKTGEEVILEKGNVIDAIIASISIPGIFPPVKLGNRLLVDGGVVNPTPINVLKNRGVERIIAVDLRLENLLEFKNPNLIQTLIKSYEIIRYTSKDFDRYFQDKNILILKPNLKKMIKFRFYEISKYISEGEKIVKINRRKLRKFR
jgi:NTE family protein